MAIIGSAIFKSREVWLHLCAQISYRNKFALRIALALFICFSISLWIRQFSELRPDRSQSQELNCHCQSRSKYHPLPSRPPQSSQTRILIISEARSGSSFLGDLLQQATNTYYSFEPLIGVEHGTRLFERLIYQIFRCQFDLIIDTYLQPIYWKVQYFKWNALLVNAIDSRDRMQLFNKTVHRMLCQNVDSILIKTIRFTLPDYWRTINEYENEKLALKVIYLVRDPRAVMSSRYRMAWCQNTENCTSSEVLCQRMRANIDTLQQIETSADKVMLLRHEDLLEDMLSSVKRLLTSLGISSVEQRLVEWIQEHTSTDDAFSNPHSTYRNVTTLASQWQTELSPEELIEIEENCGDVMQQLGYKSINQTGQEESTHRHYPLRAFSVC